MNCFQYILSYHSVAPFQTIEGVKHGPASNSELKRWFKQKCIEINGQTDWNFDEELPPIVYSLVLFPNNKKKKCTLLTFEEVFGKKQYFFE